MNRTPSMVAQVTAMRDKAQHKSPLSLPRGGYTKFRNGKSHSSDWSERRVDNSEVAGSNPAATTSKVLGYP